MNIKSPLSALILIALLVSLFTSLAPIPAQASDGGVDNGRPVRLFASAHFGPIGLIAANAFAASDVAIDGRLAQGNTTIWGGELIRVIGNNRIRVMMESLCEATLTRGTSVRFTTARAAGDESSQQVLVASLEEGSIDLSLHSDVGAYVEAAGSAFTAEQGARFGVGIEDGRALLVKMTGVVTAQDQAIPQNVKIRLVDDLGRPVASGSQLSVRARATRQVQVQVTDKNDKPLPDLPVLFSLGDPCLGSLGLGVAAGGTFRQKTDKRGIAAVPLVAGAARCAASILAKVEGTNASISIQTNVVQSKGFWNTQNTLIVVGAAAAAGIITGLVVANSGSEPIRAVPPPNIKP